MILRRSLPLFSVFIIYFALVQVSHVDSSSTSSSSRNGNRSKSKGKGGGHSPGLSTYHTSGHQYGGEDEPSLLLKPSKPDPHFEILAEQKGYKNNYRRKLREGRSGSTEVELKPTTLKEATATSSKKGCCKRKDKMKVAASTNPAQYSFMKKRVELEMMDPDPTPANPKFTGSQLISGDAGMSDGFKVMRESGHGGHNQVSSQHDDGGRDTGWKILMGPGPQVQSSSADEEEDNYVYNNDEDYSISKRAFTSMTDGGNNHVPRSITKLPQKGGGKSRGALKYGSVDDFSSLKRVTGAISNNSGKSRRGKSSQKSSKMKTPVSSIIPKQALQHKYATIKKRQPSKSSSPKAQSAAKSGKKVGAFSKVQFSTPIKHTTYETNFRRSHYSKGSGENGIDSFNPSPVMTLDTKKLVLESINSGEDSSYNRFSRLAPHIRHHVEEDLITEDDDNSNDDHEGAGSHQGFQTKTALNVGEVYSPLISVSTSLNYDPSQRKRQNGGIVTASSEDFPQLVHSPLDPPVPDEHLEALALSQDNEENGIIDDSIVDAPPPTQLAYLIPPPGSSSGRIMVRPPPPPSPKVEGPSPAASSSSGSSLSLSVPPFRSMPEHPQAQPFPDTFYYAAPNAPSEYFPFRKDFMELAYHNHPPNHFSAVKHHPPHPQDSLSSHSDLHPNHLLHHVPVILPLHPQHQRPPPRFHPHRKHPLPPFHPHPHFALGRKPIGIPIPVDPSTGRKAPPLGTFGEEHEHNGQSNLPHSVPPPPGVDPDHPAIQHALKNPQALLRDGIFIEQPEGSHLPESTKNYLQYEVHQNTLIPLDKRLVYLAMIFSWMFWITAFYTYYRYAMTGHKTNPFVLSVPKDGINPQVLTARSMDANNPWNFAKVLEYIEIAQKTYEGFDWQDLNCQKRTLCELVQNRQETFGETGRKLANPTLYRTMEALDGLPMPTIIQRYLTQYKEAITQGKNPTKDCGQIYSGCKFSIKDVLNKVGKKVKA